ncbi:MAG: TonB-dependent receptor [Rhodocyclales bacterium]|nr:TonB-dependent receptor [Rhodocyclales bacterium]
MRHRPRPLSAAVALACMSGLLAQPAQAQQAAEALQPLEEIQVQAPRLPGLNAPTNRLEARRLSPLSTADTARLLRSVPGVDLSSAGGVSSLPVIHGLADDRLRISIDGMDLISACANHMNPPLSYLDPSNLAEVAVYSAITPVSVGGDGLGSAIVVKSKTPRFATAAEGSFTSGELGTFYRSNGNARGVNASASWANENLSVRYTGATAESSNYTAAKAFKPGYQATNTIKGSHWIAGDEVGSSAYKTTNQALDMALRNANHLFTLKLGLQHIPYQNFPNQHMDMTDNRSTQVNLGYEGRFDWGTLETRVYHEHTRHSMNFGADKLFWYGASATVPGMPMDTEGKNTGAAFKASVLLNEQDVLRVGAELQQYRLNDWWDPSGGGMAPDTFVNIHNGQRDRIDFYAEWEGALDARWSALLGARHSQVKTDSGAVHGYNSGYNTDASAFNAKDRARSDNNLDLSALARYSASETLQLEGGYSRKTRSPSLYERYTWSTGGMAMTMNNWVNDGNGYVGNPDLKPEVAHTLSVSADWHDPTRQVWGLRLTPYYTLVDNYIDAVRCGPANPACVKAATNLNSGRFVYLSLANQDARLYGLDLSGFFPVASGAGWGSLTGRGYLGYTHGSNRDTGDHLYNVMPLNARLALEHQLGSWTSTLESVLVRGKHDVSGVRNEMETSGYGLLNLRVRYDWKQAGTQARIELGLENALNQQYANPLGGAYIGQGMTMALNGMGSPYGIPVPGMGRALYAALNLKF